ncbi:MAG: hypothetical protein HY901_26845 [Deltaproteobacteria bacterium]|nr:hypothetical protein [Deltaproteobacteria bacterium]
MLTPVRRSVLAMLLLCGCPQSEPELNLSVTPRSISNTGARAAVSVIALDEQGEAGSGAVRVETTAGRLEATDLTLADGKAGTLFSCSVAADSRCQGRVQLTATWAEKAITATTTVTISAPAVPTDAGAPRDASNPEVPRDASSDVPPPRLDASQPSGPDASDPSPQRDAGSDVPKDDAGEGGESDAGSGCECMVWMSAAGGTGFSLRCGDTLCASGGGLSAICGSKGMVQVPPVDDSCEPSGCSCSFPDGTEIECDRFACGGQDPYLHGYRCLPDGQWEYIEDLPNGCSP